MNFWDGLTKLHKVALISGFLALVLVPLMFIIENGGWISNFIFVFGITSFGLAFLTDNKMEKKNGS